MKIGYYLTVFKNLGPVNVAILKLSKYSTRSLISVGARGLQHSVDCRTGTSDRSVFLQIFGEREYSCFDNLSNVGLILDLGANVGYSAAYFLSRFPNCFVVAVEPDEGNFAMLERNLAPYKGRYIAVKAAVWPEETTLYFEPASMSDTNEWGRQVTAGLREGKAVRAVDVPSLMALTEYDTISILKVDIEGAEKDLFARNCAGWLDRVQNFCIEVHGDECGVILQKAIAGRGFEQSRSGELTVGIRHEPVPPTQAAA